MKAKIWYDWTGIEGATPQAAIELSNNVILFATGATFEEAKANVITRAKLLPPDEEVEI